MARPPAYVPTARDHAAGYTSPAYRAGFLARYAEAAERTGRRDVGVTVEQMRAGSVAMAELADIVDSFSARRSVA